MSDVHAYADQLRQYATHFAPRDWCYTRDTRDLKALVFDRASDKWPARVRTCFRRLVTRTPDWQRELGLSGLSWRLRMARHGLKRSSHLPDGWIPAMGVYTTWEETGEYLQYVQPSVGELLADLMDAHPELPEVAAIAAEMKRINDDYGRRIAREVADDD